MIDFLGYTFIFIVLALVGYLFIKLLAGGLSALTNNDD
jgi:hypothetical protein